MSAIRRLILALALAPALAFAQEPVRPVLPYTGHLDQNGVPFDGVLQLRFSLHAAESGADAAVFEEVQPSVPVHDGTFSVRIGDPDGRLTDAAALAAVLEQDRQYWLEVAVRPVPGPGEDPPWVTLRNRQAIHAASQALWTRKATDLTADTLTLTGGLTADSVTTGPITATDVNANNVTAEALTATHQVQVGDEVRFTGGHGARISIPNAGPEDAIDLHNYTEAEGGVRITGQVPGHATLEVEGDADIERDLTVRGDAHLEGDTTIDTLHYFLEPQIASPVSNQEQCNNDGPPVPNHICFNVGTAITADGGYCIASNNNPNWRLCARGAVCTFGCLRIQP